MNNMPIFSLIVPVYKTEKYLDYCIESILNQSFRDFELILVDDGSPDRCPATCDRYAATDDRVKVLHKENGGVSSARNAGLRIAQGQWIWFVDSDDSIYRGALQKLQETVQNQTADLYIFNTDCTDGVFEGELRTFLHRYYFSYVLQFAPWNKLFNRALLEKCAISFDIEEKIGEDLLFNISYYKAIFSEHEKVSCVFMKEKLYDYVDREGSAMNTASKYRLVQQMRLFDKIAVLLKDCVPSEDIQYFFLLHLVSGIIQSSFGGLTSEEFSGMIDADHYHQYFWVGHSVLREFFINEHASLPGKMKIYLFLQFIRWGRIRLAGKVMGLH